MMVEVFKTNVGNLDQAIRLIDRIHEIFKNYEANFDLDDCDKILRVKSRAGRIQPSRLIDLLKDFGFSAEVLQGDSQPFEPVISIRSSDFY